MQPGQYDGPGFAAELQTALRAGVTQATGAEVTSITVTHITSQASLYVTSPSHQLRIYSPELFAMQDGWARCGTPQPTIVMVLR